MFQVKKYLSELQPPLDEEMFGMAITNVEEDINIYYSVDKKPTAFYEAHMNRKNSSLSESERALTLVRLALDEISLSEVSL